MSGSFELPAVRATAGDDAESAARLRLALRVADIGIWDWDLRTDEMTWSARAREIYGFPLDGPVTVAAVRAASHPEDSPRTTELSRRARDPAIRAKEPYEFRIRRADGEIRWISALGEAFFETVDGVEKAVRYLGTMQDITETRRAENLRRESEARLRLAVDAAHLGIWDFDVATDTVRSSPELNRILGYPPDHILDRAELRANYIPGERERTQAEAQAALAAGERQFQVEYRYLVHGQVRWLLLRAEVTFGPDGKPNGALGVVMDITERKETEERHVFLVHELKHRVKNILAAVQAIATMSLARRSDVDEARVALDSRLAALAGTYDILTREDWNGADIVELIEIAARPFRADGSGRFRTSGPSARLSADLARSLSILVNELTTNAVKYGALSHPDGEVDVNWSIDPCEEGRRLTFEWKERNGPPVVAPERRGFGSRIIEAGMPRSKATLSFPPDGVRYELDAIIPD